MLVKEIIQRIQSLYSKGVQSDDSRLSSRHIYSKAKSVRSRLIQQKINKGQFIGFNSIKILPCIELVKVPINECPCIPLKGCCIYRSKYSFPPPVSGKSRHIIKSVTSIDGNTVLDEINWEGRKYSSYDKYTSTKEQFFLSGNYLYVEQEEEEAFEVVRVEFIPQDPVEAAQYPLICEQVTDCPIDSMLVDFLIEDAMVEPLVEISVQELIVAFSQMQEDSSNNTRDNLEQTTK